MLVMAFDTSTRAASVAIGDEGHLTGEFMTDIKLKHSERLMLLADALLSNTGTLLKDIELFAVTMGPGSFTGLRIAMAAVKGLAQPHDVPVAAVSSLECCALGQNASEGDIICPVFDAQRDSVYTALFRMGPAGIERLTEDSVMTAADARCAAQRLGARTVFCGDALFRMGEMFSFPGAVLSAADRMLPRASCLIGAALRIYRAGQALSYRDVMPVYLRKPQAEQDRQQSK